MGYSRIEQLVVRSVGVHMHFKYIYRTNRTNRWPFGLFTHVFEKWVRCVVMYIAYNSKY